MEGNKVMFALLLLVALCAVVAIIISAVTLSRPSSVPTITLNGLGGGQSPPIVIAGGGGGGGSGGQSGAGKIYSIAIGHDFGAQQYLDEKNFVQGFTKDLISEVCAHAGIDCRVVWDNYFNCFRSVPGSHPMGGVGLYGGWYDACSSWQDTPGRVQVFDFGDPHLKPSEIVFYTKKETSFNPLDIRDKTIGVIFGWASDETCIARQDNIKGNLIPQDKVKHFLFSKDAAVALDNGTVNAIFIGTGALDKYGFEFKLINSTVFTCALSGFSIMTRKDNTLIPHWNRGLKKMRESGRFQQLCAEGEIKHGHKAPLHPCLI